MPPGKVAQAFGMSAPQVSKLKKKLGLDHRWKFSEERRAAAYAALDATPSDTLRVKLADVGDAARFGALASALGVEGCYLASYCAKNGWPVPGAAAIPAADWHKPGTWAACAAVLERSLPGAEIVAGFRDAKGDVRAYVVCDECRAEGGCGHAPSPRVVAGRDDGSPQLCMRGAKRSTGDTLRRTGAEAKADIESAGYWTMPRPDEYTGAFGLVGLRCPEGHLDTYVYNKALRRDRCRACNGHFAEQVVAETLRAMFGGTWLRNDRKHLTAIASRRGHDDVLELDGLCLAPDRHAPPGTRIAAAHDGAQHDGMDVGKGRGRQDLRALARRDALRAALLRDEGVPFVRVSDLTPLLDRQDRASQTRVFAAIEEAGRAAGLPVPPYARFDVRSLRDGRMDALRRHAAVLGVALLTDRYPGARNPLDLWCGAHGTRSRSTAGTFLERKHCCEAGAAAAASARMEDPRSSRVAAAEEAGGVVLLDDAPASTQSSVTWACRAAGHRFPRDLVDMERTIATGREACPVCVQLGRTAFAGNRLREKRLERGLAMSGLARISGIPTSSIAAYEAGRRMSEKTEAALADALSCHRQDLGGATPAPRTATATNNTDFPTRLAAICADKGQTYTALAKAAGVTGGWISVLAQGATPASPRLAQALADVLGVGVAELGLPVTSARAKTAFAAARARKGTSRQGLADAAGTTGRLAGALEHGERRMDADTIARMARTPQVPPDRLGLAPRAGKPHRKRALPSVPTPQTDLFGDP